MLFSALLIASMGAAFVAPEGTVSPADDTQVLPAPQPPAPEAAVEELPVPPPGLPSKVAGARPSPAAAPSPAETPPVESPRVPPRHLGPFDERPLSFELRLGIATPTGAIGVAAEYSIVPSLSLGAGIGNNIWGAEPAVWLRARSIGGRQRDRAFTGSVGFSTAHFEQSEATEYGFFGLWTGPLSSLGHNEPPNTRVYERAYWVNADVGLESRTNALLIRYFVGLAGLMNPSDGVEHRSSAMYEVRAGSPVTVMLYMGIGLGFSL